MSARAAAALLLAGWLAGACGAEHEPPGRPPASLRGAIVVEPPRIGVGQVARIELTVVTPPGHRLRPPRPPREVPGFWILDTEAQPTERGPGRWVHRVVVRARARETGGFSWPATTVEVETPDEELVELELEARPLEVVSVAGDFPDRVSPFALRGAPEPEAGRGALAPFAAGLVAGGTLAALFALVRRARGRTRRRAVAGRSPEAAAAADWRSAQATLALAVELADESPERAAHAGATALRTFLAQRFAASSRNLTTEELAALAPPLGADRHWSGFVDALARLDAVRFRPGAEARAAAVREALASAQQLIAESSPEARFR